MTTATDMANDFQVLKPAGWPRPSGYSNGIAATGRQIFVAGQVGWDAGRQIQQHQARRPGQTGSGEYLRGAR